MGVSLDDDATLCATQVIIDENGSPFIWDTEFFERRENRGSGWSAKHSRCC